MTWTNSSGNPYRLFRDTENGMLAGVCAGIADYLGVEPMLVRIVAVVCLVLFLPPTIITYIVLALVLKPKPPALVSDRETAAFWRGVNTAPSDTLQALNRKFRELEDRLGQMETQVASGDFELHRKF